jgi:hypothetical protein
MPIRIAFWRNEPIVRFVRRLISLDDDGSARVGWDRPMFQVWA